MGEGSIVIEAAPELSGTLGAALVAAASKNYMCASLFALFTCTFRIYVLRLHVVAFCLLLQKHNSILICALALGCKHLIVCAGLPIRLQNRFCKCLPDFSQVAVACFNLQRNKACVPEWWRGSQCSCDESQLLPLACRYAHLTRNMDMNTSVHG